MKLAESTARGLSIEDVVDISVLQRFQDTFAKAMGVAAVTVDRYGKPITRESNFQPVCVMIRSTSRGLARCMACDARGSLKAFKEGKPQTYMCDGGMMDVAAPIIIDGEYLGGILCGQVVLAEAQEQFVEGIVARNLPLRLPYEQLVQAARQVPAIHRERLDAAVEMLFVMASHIIEMGVANLTKTKLLTEVEEKAKLKTALQSAQLRALEAQVNPHFLFNALTLIGYTAIAEEAPQTEEIAYNLSDLLRYSLRNVAKSVPLSEELEMIERYLAIQKLRFGARLQAQVSVQPEARHWYIPCMILQPLVENAVVHAVEPSIHPVHIEIRAAVEPGGLQLIVSDDGVGIESDYLAAVRSGNFPQSNGRSGIGLQNVLRRLAGQYGDQFAVQIDSKTGNGTRIALLLPLN